MQAIQRKNPGLALLLELNWDRVLYVGAIGAGLAIGSYIGSL